MFAGIFIGAVVAFCLYRASRNFAAAFAALREAHAEDAESE